MTDVWPCEHGFTYLVASSTVWLVFLPAWITALFGTCWRQCCCCAAIFCCCLDPVLLAGCGIDIVKRCCCELGKFNFCEFIWYSHCLFHVAWASTGLVWLLDLPLAAPLLEVPGWQIPDLVWRATLASVVLDLLLAGSEVVHRVRLHRVRLHRARNPGPAGADGHTEPEGTQLQTSLNT